MSATDDLHEVEKKIVKARILSRNLNIYADYLEAGGKRRLSDWLSYRFTEDDFTCWPARQAGHLAERNFQPLGETE
jgi:hypothetical protein